MIRNSFVQSTTHNGVEHKATHSSGVLGSYRFFFSKYHGIEGSYSYALNTQKYMSNAGSVGVKAHWNEASGAYVFRVPMRRITPFALAGAGALIFVTKDNAAASNQTRAAFIYGGGADIHLTRHIFARAVSRVCL